MTFRFGRKAIVLIVVMGLAIGFSVYGLVYAGHPKSYPHITTSNVVNNETIQENFYYYSATNASLFYYNATSSFIFNSQTSNLSLETVWAPQFIQVAGYVEVFMLFYMYGQIAPGLHPTRLLVNLSNLGPYNNADTKAEAGFTSSVPPYNVTDTTPGPANNIIVWQNFSIEPLFNLINQTKLPAYYEFGLAWQPVVEFFIPSSGGVGTHLLHLTASLEGLGTAVQVQINVLLVDKT